MFNMFKERNRVEEEKKQAIQCIFIQAKFICVISKIIQYKFPEIDYILQYTSINYKVRCDDYLWLKTTLRGCPAIWAALRWLQPATLAEDSS